MEVVFLGMVSLLHIAFRLLDRQAASADEIHLDSVGCRQADLVVCGYDERVPVLWGSVGLGCCICMCVDRYIYIYIYKAGCQR